MSIASLIDVAGAIGLVALVMMLTRSGSRGPQLVESLSRSWQRAATATIAYGK